MMRRLALIARAPQLGRGASCQHSETVHAPLAEPLPGARLTSATAGLDAGEPPPLPGQASEAVPSRFLASCQRSSMERMRSGL